MDLFNIGVVGLGVMGKNLALNINRNGYSVAAFDSQPEKMRLNDTAFACVNILAFPTLDAFCQHLEKPRRLITLIPSGKSVDELLGQLKQYLQKDDLVIDCGNSYFAETERRIEDLRTQGIHYIGAGISGGEEGALMGPAIMPGGAQEGWPLIENIFKSIAAKLDDGTPCCTWIGSGGSGHFVKMVHNGIEYADMQLICEVYMIMQKILDLKPAEMSKIFFQWNTGELHSYLVEITGQILSKIDQETGRPLIDMILDTASQKGTGKWTSQVALDLDVPAPSIAEAVFARAMSFRKEERVSASGKLPGPDFQKVNDRNDFVNALQETLHAAKICVYAQGFDLLLTASLAYGWKLNLSELAQIWQGGCIIRAKLLDQIKAAYLSKADLSNLLLDDSLQKSVTGKMESYRQVLTKVIKSGIPVPALSSALMYYDSYRSNTLPANLLQAQRDYFGAHTYERIDKPRGEFFHQEW